MIVNRRSHHKLQYLPVNSYAVVEKVIGHTVKEDKEINDGMHGGRQKDLSNVE